MEADQPGHPRSSEDEGRDIPDPSPPRPPARLLDQRLQIRDTLFEITILLGLGLAGRRGDGYGDSIRMTL